MKDIIDKSDSNLSVHRAEKESKQRWADLQMEDFTEPFMRLFEAEKNYLRAAIAPRACVLDVGCGIGRSISDLLPITENIIGIDYYGRAVARARGNFSTLPTINILQADAARLPFGSKEFDFVICMNTFVNFGNKKFTILEEMKRVLKTSGKIVVSAYCEDAFDKRMEFYRKVGWNVKRDAGGGLIFEGGRRFVDEPAIVAEQFSKKQLEGIFLRANLHTEDITKAEITYLCTLARRSR